MHRDLLFDYALTMNRHIGEWSCDLGTKTIYDGNDEGLVVCDEQLQINLSILLEIIFGQNLKDPVERAAFLQSWEEVSEILEFLFDNPHMCNIWIWRIYSFFTGNRDNKMIQNHHNNMSKIIESRIRSIEFDKSLDSGQLGDKKKKLLIDVLLQLYQEGTYTFNDVRNEAFLFFAAALDTTSHAMTGGIYALSLPQTRQVRQKLQSEIDRHFPEVADLEQFTPDILNSMPYLDAVVKEILRSFAPAKFIAREICGPVTFTSADGDQSFCIKNPGTSVGPGCPSGP